MNKTKLYSGLGLALLIVVVSVSAGLIMGDTTRLVDYTKELKVESADISDYITEDESPELAAFYKADMSAYYDGDNTGSMYYIFDTDNSTFTMVYGCEEVGDGTYTMEGNEVILLFDGASEENATRYLLDNNILMAETNICSGEIPATDTFDITCYQRSSSTSVYYYEFKEDGSYTLKNYVKTDDDKDDKMYSGEGTYTRDGDYITTTISDTVTPPYLIYKNHLVTSYFEEITAEQYRDEYADNYAIAQSANDTSDTE